MDKAPAPAIMKPEARPMRNTVAFHNRERVLSSNVGPKPWNVPPVMAAAAMTESNIVGMVGGVAIPPARGTFVAFEAGVRSVDPDIEVLETFTGDWNDVSAAKEAAVAQLSRAPVRGYEG